MHTHEGQCHTHTEHKNIVKLCGVRVKKVAHHWKMVQKTRFHEFFLTATSGVWWPCVSQSWSNSGNGRKGPQSQKENSLHFEFKFEFRSVSIGFWWFLNCSERFTEIFRKFFHHPESNLVHHISRFMQIAMLRIFDPSNNKGPLSGIVTPGWHPPAHPTFQELQILRQTGVEVESIAWGNVWSKCSQLWMRGANSGCGRVFAGTRGKRTRHYPGLFVVG